MKIALGADHGGFELKEKIKTTSKQKRRNRSYRFWN